MSKSEVAKNYFANQFNCAQSVFVAFATDYGFSVDDGLKVACAFGGGMGRQQHTCGAVSGALMAIGLKYGKALNDDEEKKAMTYAKTCEFFKEFEKVHGSTNCKSLLKGYDMSIAAELDKIKSQNLFGTLCPKYVESAVEIAERLMK